jgi:hypothetical protein
VRRLVDGQVSGNHVRNFATLVSVPSPISSNIDTVRVSSYPTVAAAITAAGAGGTLLFDAVEYVTTATLVPLTAQTWRGSGMTRYDSTAGTTIKYTGTGKAIDLTSVNNFGASDLKIEITDTAAVAYYRNGTNFDHLTNVTIDGPGTGGTSYGIKSEGSVGCQCHGRFTGVQVSGFATGISLSGFSNANEFVNCQEQICGVALNFTATGGDTTGGNDNLFERFEQGSTITTGVVLASTASRNVFLKFVQDGVTGVGSIASGCQRNGFIHSVLVGTPTDAASNLTLFLLTTGAGTPAGDGLQIGDLNLYRTGTNQWKTDDDLHVVGSGGGVAAKVGAYAGSLASSTGVGVFGNSEFSNALAIGGALNHDGTTVGFFGVTPAARPTTYAASNVTVDRTYDANATTLDEVADVLGTLIADLRTMGLVT